MSLSVVKNTKRLLTANLSPEQRKARQDLLAILEFALRRSDPFYLTKKALRKINFKKYRSVFVIGAGKGTYRMALAAEKILGTRLTAGWISVPKRIRDGCLKKIRVTLAGHPFPNQGSVRGARRILDLVRQAGKDDLVLALFSGGASALFCLPAENVSLEDKIKITGLLLRSGAKINEVNAVRKHLSQVKGGWLAQKAAQTNLVAFYLSDVVGDDLSAAASGPTVADLSTYPQTIKILEKYKIWQATPVDIKKHLKNGKRGAAPETPKKISRAIKNIIIGNHRTLAEAAEEKGKTLGCGVKILTAQMAGETEKVGPDLLKQAERAKVGFLFIAAGETTFKVRTKNPGGRNQQMGLAVLPKLKPGIFFLAFDSDGVDGVGPEKVGGVIIDSSALEKSRRLRLNIKKALRTNDSYRFFQKVGGQIKTGYVGTNLGDLVLITKRGVPISFLQTRR